MLKISNLSFVRGNSLIFKKVNLEINQSEIVIIKGPNGSGKSTFLSCIAHLAEPIEGSIKYFSDEVDETIASKNFIFIGENNFAFDDLSIIENINYWINLNNVKINDHDISRSINFLYGNIDLKKKFFRLSFGQKKKFRILLIMLIDKPVWILDDPFNGLDYQSISQITKVISLKRDKNGLILIASHQSPLLTNLKEFTIS